MDITHTTSETHRQTSLSLSIIVTDEILEEARGCDGCGFNVHKH